jgi:hypothetical protein
MKYQKIPGYFDFQELYNNIIDFLPDGSVFVEVGCYKGRSIVYFLEMMKRKNKDFIVCVADWFKGTEDEPLDTDFYDEFIENIKEAGYENDLSVFKMTSNDAAYKCINNEITACFIDANHEYEDVKKDILTWLPKVRPGGILAGHDIDFPGVWRAVKECLPNIEINNRCWIYKKEK